ncbi:MAG: GspE/PulE family protein, partial [Candidatus Omnitrophota bacterium]
MAKIGEILVEKGLVSRGDLKRAIEESKKSGEVLGKTLLRLKFIEEGRFLEALGEQLGMDFYHSLSNIVVARETIDAVPVKLVWHYKFMPLKIEGKKLIVAVSDPMAIWFVDDLKLQLGYDIERVLATEKEISQAIRKYYGFGAETVEQILSQGTLAEKQRGREEQESKEENIQEGQEDASVINLVNQILSEAISARATDIHIEPYRDKVRVRYRIDGMLYDMNVPEQIR